MNQKYRRKWTQKPLKSNIYKSVSKKTLSLYLLDGVGYPFIFVTNLLTNSRAALKTLSKVFIVLIMLFLVGFTYTSNDIEKMAGTMVTSDEGYNMNTSLVEFTDKGTMKASWYGPRFHGKLTANGEIYNQMGFTAAHKSMKFGTLLRLTNPANNKSIVVRINDRGPYIPGRHLDLSKAAAIELDIIKKGVAKLKVEEVTLKGLNMPVVTLN